MKTGLSTSRVLSILINLDKFQSQLEDLKPEKQRILGNLKNKFLN